MRDTAGVVVLALLLWLAAAGVAVIVQVRRRLRSGVLAIAGGAVAVVGGLLAMRDAFGIAVMAWGVTSVLIATRGRVEEFADVELRDVAERDRPEATRRTRRVQWTFIAMFVVGTFVLAALASLAGYDFG